VGALQKVYRGKCLICLNAATAYTKYRLFPVQTMEIACSVKPPLKLLALELPGFLLFLGHCVCCCNIRCLTWPRVLMCSRPPALTWKTWFLFQAVLLFICVGWVNDKTADCRMHNNHVEHVLHEWKRNKQETLISVKSRESVTITKPPSSFKNDEWH